MPFMQKYRVFFLFFLFVFACNLLFPFWLPSYTMVAKPMIMASLIGLYISTAQPQSNTFLLGLIAALMGDIFLLFPGDSFFGLGLGAFLLMQILYCIEFYKQGSFSRIRIFLYAMPVYLTAFVFLLICWQKLGEWQNPVAFYSLAIASMTSLALLRKEDKSSYTAVSIGSLLFMLSDLSLAFNKFVFSSSGSDIIVMSTYMAAQFLIVSGISQFSNSQNQK